MVVITPDKEPAREDIMGTAVFMATALLRTIWSNGKITQTFAHDAESFAYVILYNIYKHAAEDTQRTSASLLADFGEFFSATDVVGVLGNRGMLFSRGAERPMPHLLAYLDGDVALNVCAGVTLIFVRARNMYQEDDAPLNPPLKRVEALAPSPHTVPFDEVHTAWIKGLREVVLEASRVQGGATQGA
ncbi:hypothetical protein C8T65DRAFT_743497 [Cerioporus squamosus]|nr:hypothetical protein C8T65DRAFT_743497 [Cerioporus squamosus]